MTWDQGLLLALALIDLAALGVGLTVLRRVTSVVVEAGEAIQAVVDREIVAAKVELSEAVAGVLGRVCTPYEGSLGPEPSGERRAGSLLPD